ncbi:hypothetical protein F4825DRAFT_465998 [Nemania diffusa]|nr:hypothetical protein F4825DRAFT_465998 [Nemania diffusa]
MAVTNHLQTRPLMPQPEVPGVSNSTVTLGSIKKACLVHFTVCRHCLHTKRRTRVVQLSILADITILPTCDSNRDNLAIAIVRFPRHQQPEFLADLTQNPLGELSIPVPGNGKKVRESVVFDRHFHGFTQLYPTSNDRPVRADIVAITGMDGHAYGSWMSKEVDNVMWLRDFLARDLPACRTMIYGYHSKLLASNMSQLKEYGRQFLAEIEKVRDTKELQRRPLIFICHSYGGIILSHCLVLANNLESEHRKSLYTSTYGMLFFGTPHRGSPKDDVLKMVEQRHPNRVPALMQTAPDSGELEFQLQLFSNLVGDRQIGSFYETEPTPVPAQVRGQHLVVGRSVLQVSEPSATLQLLRERKIPVNANHTNMVKFNTPLDPTYTTVVKMLREFVRDAPRVVRQRYDSQKKVTVPFNRSLNLYGRTSILKRLEELFESTEHHCRVALTGLGGIGKSAIATKYAQNHLEKNPEASVFWVQSSTAATFGQSYQEIAETLKIKGRDESKVDLLKLVYDYLSDEQNGPWLMILDGADDRALLSMDNARQNDSTGYYRQLSSFLPQGTHGSILITSRDRRVAEDLTGSPSSILHVYAFKQADSVRLMRERSRDEDSPNKDVVELVNSLDNHALAITQAAAFISNSFPRMNITRYLSLYQKALKHQRPENLVLQPVSAAWQLSFDTIREEYPYSFKLLSLMSIFHFNHIPDFLFIGNTPRYETNESLFEEDLEPLLRFSLIMLDSEKFNMHRLVQQATRAWLLANHEMDQRVQEALVLVAGIESLSQRKLRGKILYNVAYFEYTKRDYGAALKRFVGVKEIQSESLKEDDEQVVLTRNMCYRLLSKLGQGEMAIHQVDSELLNLHQRSPGSIQSNEYLALLEERARIRLDDGQLKEAEADAAYALDHMVKRDDVSEVHRLNAKRTLARAINFQGEPEQAEPLLREVLERRKQLWGPGHIDTLKSVLDLAQCLGNQGRYHEADRHFETAKTGLRHFGKRRADRAQKIWEETRLASRQRGFPAIWLKLRRVWRQTRLRIFGSSHNSLQPVSRGQRTSRSWHYVVFGVPLVFILILTSVLFRMWQLLPSEEQVHLWRLSEKLIDEWSGHHVLIAERMDNSEAVDRDQGEWLRQLDKEIQELKRQRAVHTSDGTNTNK